MVCSLTLPRRCVSSVAVNFCCDGNSPLTKNATSEVNLFLTSQVVLSAEPFPPSCSKNRPRLRGSN